ncbi:MAG: esterase/lipase [Candidatus Azotimanducaceae bacterium]
MAEIKPPHLGLTLLEGRVIGEAGALLLTMPLLRMHAKKGMGEPVVVLPGFMADDRSTRMLRHFLTQIGYDAKPWGLGINRLPLMQLLPALRQGVESLVDASGQKARLVGWSRGGILARELARDYPELIERVITIGSPVKGGVGASAIGRWVQQETGMTREQMAAFAETRNHKPINVPVRAIYSRSDGVVAWKACIDDVTDDVEHFEVISSHVGLGSNVEVFRLIPGLMR